MSIAMSEDNLYKKEWETMIASAQKKTDAKDFEVILVDESCFDFTQTEHGIYQNRALIDFLQKAKDVGRYNIVVATSNSNKFHENLNTVNLLSATPLPTLNTQSDILKHTQHWDSLVNEKVNVIFAPNPPEEKGFIPPDNYHVLPPEYTQKNSFSPTLTTLTGSVLTQSEWIKTQAFTTYDQADKLWEDIKNSIIVDALTDNFCTHAKKYQTNKQLESVPTARNILLAGLENNFIACASLVSKQSDKNDFQLSNYALTHTLMRTLAGRDRYLQSKNFSNVEKIHLKKVTDHIKLVTGIMNKKTNQVIFTQDNNPRFPS
jgi:hypothetical protein